MLAIVLGVRSLGVEDALEVEEETEGVVVVG